MIDLTNPGHVVVVSFIVLLLLCFSNTAVDKRYAGNWGCIGITLILVPLFFFIISLLTVIVNTLSHAHPRP